MINLTKPQQLIRNSEKFTGGAIAVLCGSLLKNGSRDIAEINQAINKLYHLNDALRIRIKEVDGKDMQTVSDYVEQKFDVHHFNNKAELLAYAADYAKEPLDLYGALSEIKIIVLPNQYGALIKMHHLISDAWTFSLLGTQFNKLISGKPVEAHSYLDYIESENIYLQSKRHAKDRAFFLEQFAKCDDVTYISEKQSDSLETKRTTFVLDAGKSTQLKRYAEQHDASVFVLFTTALAAYINHTKMNAEKFYIGTAVLNRAGSKEQNTAGMFVNTVPILMELDNSGSFANNLSRVKNATLLILRHQKFNYEDVLSSIRQEYNFGEKLYDVLISYQNAAIAGGEVETIWHHCGMQNESLQIHIDDRDNEGVFRIHYDYRVEKFTSQEIERMHQHLCNLLFNGIANDTKKLCELTMLSQDEQQQLLHDFNNTVVDFPKNRCVHQLFEEQAAKTPDKIAVTARDRTLTYQELNEEANRIAHALIEQGATKGDIVAFELPRTSFLIATIMGIMKSGAAYLPIDPDYPQERINYMLTDSQAKLHITKDNFAALRNHHNTTNPNTAIAPSDLCYCIYTSGSTGKPKGTLLTHGNAYNYVCRACNNVYDKVVTHANTAIVSVATVGFDMFVTESLLPLANGFGIVLADENQSKLQGEFDALLQQSPATFLQTTPTKLRALTFDQSHLDFLKHLDAIGLGGEALDEALIDTISQHTNAKIFNLYGPTEATVWATIGEITNSKDIHIGKPMANAQVHIVDKFMNLVPVGVAGELCIAGEGVGAGYLNRPELTNERFIKNPFGAGKLYKTGDLAYWREDGNITYIGRNDFQVKIRGLRVELGEIENALEHLDGVSQAVVVVRKNDEGRQVICAFYTGEEIPSAEIRTLVAQELPKYMVPHIFTHLDAMPLTSSGKVNRNTLPNVNLYAIDITTEYVAPQTPQEQLLASIIQDVLKIEKVGTADNFFDLGGDSLKAIEFVSKAHQEGICFDLQAIFDYPTIQELCTYLEVSDQQAVSFDSTSFTAVNALLKNNTVEYLARTYTSDVGNILLTGATGYLGAHILADFLDHDSGTAYCLVRGENEAASTERLHEVLRFYFGNTYDGSKRIRVVCADLQQDQFGLTDALYQELLDTIDTVINAAASVKHYGTYQYFYEANVKSTERLIDFCKAGGARLIHTSTTSVAGLGFSGNSTTYTTPNEQPLHFAECNLYANQSLDNVYVRSKFEAEKAVLDAAVEGLPVHIMRMGNLTNRARDGQFQKNYQSNAFLKRMLAIFELGIAPDYLASVPVEFTPVDEAAHAVMTLTRSFDARHTVFHINNSKVIYLRALFELANELGLALKIVEETQFTKALREAAQQPDREHILEAFVGELDENNRLKYDNSILVDNTFTTQRLQSLGFEWSDITIDYLHKYVNHCRKIGVLNA